MPTYAQTQNTDDGKYVVIAVVEGEGLWAVPNPPGVDVWFSIEVTPDTGIPRIGDRYEEGKFVRDTP